jgi:hypothetical protein
MIRKRSNKGQVTIEYSLVMIIMAGIASLIFVVYENLTESTFYGTRYGNVNSMGLEKTVSLPFP